MTRDARFDASVLQDYTLATRKLVMYPHLNYAERLFGGQLLAWIDEGCAMVAGDRMKRRSIATKKISEVVFEAPGMNGDVVEIWCKTEREGTTSLTLDCIVVVHRENQELTPICRCNLVYVAIDPMTGRPTPWRREPGRE